MRIQHNIMAMNAYRNFSNNTAALSKNLEKLSSGYKINRAGDDAAGLAISEKMRAQITGLEAAQKNAKDGISLVQTAEGALTEVHDMLNRMVELASQSANGTYDNETDRAQLQKELEQLRTEVDRIADSSNFNGINLLDGSLAVRDAVAASTSTKTEDFSGMDRILTDVIGRGENATDVAGQKTILDTDTATATAGAFEVDLSTLNFTVTGPSTATAVSCKFTLKIGGTEITATATGISASATTGSIATIIRDALLTKIGSEGITINGVKWDVASGTVATAVGLKFTQASIPKTAEEAKTNFDVSVSLDNNSGTIQITPVGGSGTGNNDVIMGGSVKVGTQVTKQGVALESANTANTVFEIKKEDLKDGTQIAIGDTTIILRMGGSNSAYATWAASSSQTLTFGTATFAGRVLCIDIKDTDDLNTALQKISAGIAGSTGTGVVHFITKGHLGAASAGSAGLVATEFQIGVSDTSQGFPAGLAVQRKETYTASATNAKYDSLEKLAANFKMKVTTKTTTEAQEATKGLTLQIGDTTDSYNQLDVSIADCHAAAIGIGDIDISTQAGAQSAVEKIKSAINQISDVRGTLGATQNRLDHTINNLSVMQENIQDAESTIRDVDVASEMMAYTKNNILIQSAQAMLAQANQVPQGVLQLLQ